MKKRINLGISSLMLSLIILNSGCASLGETSPPALENRTLKISDKVPGFEYQYFECVKKGLFGCRQWELRTETYDLTDSEVREKLKNMGFVAKVKDKVSP